MNKIYKVIFSEVRGAWVVVSELVTGHTKSPGKRAMRAALAAAVAAGTLLGAQSSQAADSISGKSLDIYGESHNTVTPLNTDAAAAAIGRDNYVYGGQSLAIGIGNWIGIDTNTASEWIKDIETSSISNGSSSLAVGSGNIIKGGFSAAIGETVRATGDYSFAQGVGSHGGSDYFPGSTAYGKAASAFNVGTLASGEGATSHGRRTVAGGNYSAAFGDGAYAKGTGAFAVGTTGYNNVVGSSIEDIDEYYSNKEENEANNRFYIPNLSRENAAAFSPIYYTTSSTYEQYYKNRPQTTGLFPEK